jgi:hypothetical protein
VGAILIAVQKEAFVVLAADRAEQNWSAAHTVDTQPKLILHPSLPLAIAWSGFPNFADRRSGRDLDTSNYLERLLAEITQPSELVLDRIQARISNRMHPLVRDRLRSVGAPGPDDRLDVVIGFLRGTTSGLGVMRLAQGWRVRRCRPTSRHQARWPSTSRPARTRTRRPVSAHG